MLWTFKATKRKQKVFIPLLKYVNNVVGFFPLKHFSLTRKENN